MKCNVHHVHHSSRARVFVLSLHASLSLTRNMNVTVAKELYYIYSASMKSYQYGNFDISENIEYSSLATVTFMFLVNDKLV